MLSRAFERRDDIARIEASGVASRRATTRRGRGPAFGGRSGTRSKFGACLVALGGAAEIVGEDADLRMQHVVPGEPEDVYERSGSLSLREQDAAAVRRMWHAPPSRHAAILGAMPRCARP